VLHDVRNGYVTREKAREIYRVVVEAVNGDFMLNDQETRALRAEATGHRP
jgi:hypothetical protein